MDPPFTMRFRAALLDGQQDEIAFAPRRIYNAANAARQLENAGGQLAPRLAPVSAHNLVMCDLVQEYCSTMIGEVEYVLIWHHGEILLSVGSDHHDYVLEERSFVHAKNCAPNIIAQDVWYLRDVIGHFDDLLLECHVGAQGTWRLAQQARCATLLPPNFWMESSVFKDVTMDATVLFGGTISHLAGLVQGTSYRVTMSDPKSRRSITHEYHCEAIKITGDFCDGRPAGSLL